METTVTLSTEIKQQLADLQLQLRQERGYPVTYNQVIEYLLQARTELARRLTVEWEGGA